MWTAHGVSPDQLAKFLDSLFVRMTLQAGVHAARLLAAGAAPFALKDVHAIKSFATKAGVRMPGVDLDPEMAAPDCDDGGDDDSDDSDGNGEKVKSTGLTQTLGQL